MVKAHFPISDAMRATLEKTLEEILQDMTFSKAAAQRLSMTSVDLETNLSVRMAILNKCVRSVVALCALRARAAVRRNTTTEAAMTAWVDLLNRHINEMLEWIKVGATPHQMAALKRYGLTPGQVSSLLEASEGRVTITRLAKDPTAVVRR